MLNNTIQPRIQWLIAAIDQLINKQLNALLHHPRFQQLESSWRGLYYLAGELPPSGSRQGRVKLKMLNVAWPELSKDLMRAVEFDQTQLFLKVYNNEFGQPGGEPFGLLLGDYALSHRLDKGVNDIEALRVIAKVAAAAFAPFIAAISPRFLGLDSFTQLEKNLNFARTFQQIEYQLWKTLRQDEDSRFLGLLLPQVLWRLPYQHQQAIRYPFCFYEEMQVNQDYLWGSPVYCFATTAIRAFQETGWFSAMRGASADSLGGRVQHLPTPVFRVDQSILAKKAPVNIYITDHQEKELSDQGLIPLCAAKTPGSVLFYDCPSVQKPAVYQNQNALQNSRLSSLLHYILCVSRFAHYIKIIARDQIGSFTSAEDCERKLQNWLQQYIAASNHLSENMKMKYPLRDAKVVVHDRLGDANAYFCTIHISPHYQFDYIQTDLYFHTELVRSL